MERVKQVKMNPTDRESLRCHLCGAPLATARNRCASCGAERISPSTLEWAQQATVDLARNLANSPYLRGVGGIAYTLRGQLKGFLDDPESSLSRHLLRYLFLLSVEGGSAGLSHLLRLAGTVWILPGTPLLIPTVVYLRNRYAEQLKQAALGDDAVRLRRLRAAARRGETDPAELEAFVTEAFARWHSSLVSE